MVAVTAAGPSARAGAGERVANSAFWAILDEVRDLFPPSDDSVGSTPFEDWKLRAHNAASASRSPAAGGVAAEDSEVADLREEVAYWRRDAAARIWASQALMQAYRKEGRDDLAFAHRDALRAAVGASEAVQAQDWHPTCELCGKPMLPGEATYYFAEEGISAHDRCAVEGAKDDTGAPDPSDADWRERVKGGRAALSADDEDPDEPVRLAAPAGAAPEAVAADHVLVPVEPTPEMLQAAWDSEHNPARAMDLFRVVWAAMVAASSPSASAALASPAETKATLADATFDLAAPTHRVEAGAVAGDLGGVEAKLRMFGAAERAQARAEEASDEAAADRADKHAHRPQGEILDAVRALITPAEDAKVLVDTYLTAIAHQTATLRSSVPGLVASGECQALNAAHKDVLAARLALFAHLAAKDRELDALRRSGAAGDGVRVAVVPSRAAQDVFEERLRQIEVEGWTSEHDDEHSEGQIGRAALNYLAAACVATALDAKGFDAPPPLDRMGYAVGWPWAAHWWKPGPTRRMLVKAGALILAEIERLDRADRSRISVEDRATPSAVPAVGAARGPEGVRAPACAWRTGCQHTVACSAEQRCLGPVLRAGDALIAQANRPAPGHEAATPDTARPSRAEGDGGRHGTV